MIRGLAAFVAHQGKVFQILGYTSSARWPHYADLMNQTVSSFERLTDRRYLEVEPKRLSIVDVPRTMSLREFAERYPSTVPLETLAIINETTVDGICRGGTRQARRGRPAPGRAASVDAALGTTVQSPVQRRTRAARCRAGAREIL